MLCPARAPRGAIWWVLVAVVSFPATGRAQLHLVGEVYSSVGVTDNPTSVPSDSPEHVTDGLFTVAPRLILSHDSGTHLHYLAYTFTYLLYMRRPEVNAYSNRVRYAASFQLSDHTRLSLGVGATQGERRLFNLGEEADQSQLDPLDAQPQINFVTAGADQGLEWDISPVWELSQSLGFEAFIPIETTLPQSNNYRVGNLVGVRRTWSVDALASRVRVDYFTFGEIPEADRPTLHGVTTAADLQWLHDLTPSWSTELAAGVMVAFRADNLGAPIVHPRGLAAIRYLHERWRIELSGHHHASPNLFSRQMTMNSGAHLSVLHPLDRQDDWVARASAGYRHTLPYSPDWEAPVDREEGYHLALFDAELSWRVYRTLYLSVRYQLDTRQGGQREEITRHLGLLGLTFRYPPEGFLLPFPRLRRSRVDQGRE